MWFLIEDLPQRCEFLVNNRISQIRKLILSLYNFPKSQNSFCFWIEPRTVLLQITILFPSYFNYNLFKFIRSLILETPNPVVCFCFCFFFPQHIKTKLYWVLGKKTDQSYVPYFNCSQQSGMSPNRMKQKGKSCMICLIILELGRKYL